MHYICVYYSSTTTTTTTTVMKNKTKFDETDVDGSGDLDPNELVPIILEISKMHHGDVSPDRAVEFCKVFDDDGNGNK
jgi:hypothetical protein